MREITTIATPNTKRRKICTGLKLKPRTMSAFMVGLLRSAMRPPSWNASESASGGAESAPATLNVVIAGEDATTASVDLDPPTCSVLSCGTFCCGIEGASLCSIGFTAEDVAAASVGLDPSTCSVLSCGTFSCGAQGAPLCSIGFAAAGEDVAAASVSLDPSTCSVLSCGTFCCGIEEASLCSIGFAAADVAEASLCPIFLPRLAAASVGLDPSTCSVLSCGTFCCGIEEASLCSMGFAAADVAAASVGLDPSTCSVLSCGTFCCGIEEASLCSIGFTAEDVAAASVGLDPSTCSVLSCGTFSCGIEGRATLLDRFCGCGRGRCGGIGQFRSIDL